ncbi:VOC family protein [Thalassotalea agarivorans]|uniref:VOC domain-containing protein n=1 Tax=Thalassotalea agarivorans TaxID=349064 RepID=A0A1I0DKS9_THASX|nr:VOC family protein [Thalassotalea agarivorans]SET33080.1 hypothetical protein SAMN05660429_01562 [Thalassotalea agarivorans]
MADQIVWLDMPTTDLARASKFYTGLLGAPVQYQEMDGMEFAMFPDAEKSVSGCLIPGTEEDILKRGALIYFNVDGRIVEAEQWAKDNGGEVLEPIHAIGPYGFRSVIHDSEGNRIALHSQSNA